MEENNEFAQFLNVNYYLPNLDTIESDLIEVEKLLKEESVDE